MNCPFNVVVNSDEMRTGYESHKFHYVDFKVDQIITCVEERCAAWVDVVVGQEIPEMSQGNLPYREAIKYPSEPIIEKRCARLVNPADIVTK